MAKTVSVESELLAIRSICDGTEDVQTLLLAHLQTGHFASPSGSPLFDRIRSLARNGKPVPNISIFKEDPTIDTDAQDSLEAETGVCESEADAKALSEQLELFRKLRVVHNGTRDVVDSIKESTPETVETALQSLERVIVQARSNTQDISLVTSGVGSNAETVVDTVLSQAKLDRIETGFKKFDEATGGFARKDLVLIAANTGGGKTVMAEQLAINAYLRTGQNRNVALVSFEMDEEELYARCLSNITEIPFDEIYLRRLSVTQRLRCKKAWESFNKHGEINNCKFTIWCPTIDVTPSQIGAILKPGEYDEILIDYVGLVEPEQQAALWENLGEITKGFKGVARRNNCVSIVMAQLDEDTNKVKYSKAMKHHSSYVWQWVYDEEAETREQVEINQSKTRHCKRFNFSLITNFSTMSFSDGDDTKPASDVSSREEAAAARKNKPQTGEYSPADTKAEMDRLRRKLSNLSEPDLDENDL